jgi:hypothetical protein
MVGREGMVEQSCSLHDSQESGRERERETEREKGTRYMSSNQASPPNSPLSYELINGLIHGEDLWLFYYPNNWHCIKKTKQPDLVVALLS